MKYLMLWFTCWAGTAAASVDFLAYGDLRGHIEPCGCDPSTDLGGIKRLGSVIERERRIHPALLLFDLGNDLPLPNESSLKSPFILAATAALAPKAVLLNALEIRRLSEINQWIHAPKRPRLPYVLSNLRNPGSLGSAVQTVINGPDWVVLGYVSNDAKTLVPIGPELVKRWQRLLLKESGKNKILLFSGSDAELHLAEASRLFDVIVSSNTQGMDGLPGAEERNDESKLVRSKQPPVMMTPLGGQGLLRGGALQFDEAKTLAGLFKDQDTPQPNSRDPLLKPATLVTWLDPASAPDDGPLASIYRSYTEAARLAFLNDGAKRVEQLKSTPFAGAQACAACHPEQTKVYLKSQHAHAMATLQSKGKHEDAECVSCHSVGAKVPGGFVSLSASPQFANVQCENCHGPRLAHTRDPHGTPRPQQPAHDACVACHNAQHSSKFDFTVYWPRIQH